MKQIFYTSCEAGRSLNGAEGFQVRGASAGIGPERIRAAKPYMAYDLPPFVNPSQLTPESSPVRLAFLKTPEFGSVLCHSVSAGQDPSTHRPGNFFSHLLLNMPPAFTAAAVVKTWESDSWQRTDGPFDATLPDIEEIHPADVLTDEALSQFLSSQHGQRMFRFVLAALLTTEADWRIFLAASSQDVALGVYGLTRVLPDGCQKTLTFSTYESQPLTCSARVVGTWAGDSADTDMPSSCYFGRAVGYNSSAGRASQVTLDGEFVDFAATAATTGDRQALDDLLSVCHQCGIDRPDLLNLVYRIECKNELAAVDVRRLALYPRFLSHLLGNPDVQRPLIDQFSEDQELAGIFAAQVVPVLKENNEAITLVREGAKQAAVEAILHGKLTQARTLLEHILPAASDASAASTRMEVLDEISNPVVVPWQTRAYLLTQMPTISSEVLRPAFLSKWLSVPVADLPLLCGLVIPNDWKLCACLDSLRHAGTTSSLVDTLTNHPELLLELLRRIPGDEDAARNLPSLVAAMLARSNAPAKLLGDLVHRRNQLSPEVTSAFLAAAARSGKIDVFSLASQCGPGLLDVLDGGNNRDTFMARLLDCPAEQLLSNGQVLALCQAAVQDMAPGEIRDGLESVLAIRSFLNRPALSEARLVRVAQGLKTLRNAAITKRVLQYALAAMLADDDSPHIQPVLECLIGNLGPVTSSGSGDMYRWLLQQFQTRMEFWDRQHLICAMVAIGLGATESATLLRHSIVTAEPARDLAEDVAKRSKRRVFALIDRQSRAWPVDARLRWDLFAKFVRPRGIFNRITATWKKTITVSFVLLGLVVGASKLGCKDSTVGAGFAGHEASIRQSHATSNPLAEKVGHDRPQP